MTDYFTAEQVYQSLKEENAALRKFCHEAQAENETLRMGYAAARLEIESLQARIKTMAEEHADELTVAHLDGRMRAAQPVTAQQPGAALSALFREAIAWGMAYGPVIPAHQWDEMRESMVKHYADRAVRVAQPAGAQQPASHGGVSVEPTPEQIMAAAKVMQSHDVPDDEPKWDELPDWQIKVWLEGAEKALKAAWVVTAPTSQPAPAQAAPAAVAGPWSAGELDGNWLDIDHKDHAGVIRIVWKMEGEARNPVCEARAMAVIDALNAYATPTAQTAPTPQADSQPAPVREEEREAFKAAHRHLELDEVPDAWGRPTFKQSHVEASWLGWIAHAARAPADSVTAPVGGETYHLGACIVEDMLHATVMRKEPGRAGAVTVLLSEQIPVEHLQDRDVIVNATPPAQAADSVLEDAARLDWLDEDAGNHVTIVGKTWYTRPTYGHPYRKHKNLRAAIDAARAAQEGKSHGN